LSLCTPPWGGNGKWGYISTILNLDTRLRWEVSFTLLPLYPRYSLDTLLSGAHSRSGHWGKRTISCYCLELNPRFRAITSIVSD
jgi:hypothetical protein